MSEIATTPSTEPMEARGHSDPEPHHAINYLLIFYALIVLTVITVAIAFVRFESELINVLLALLVASVKGTLVARYFMHLKFEGKLIRGILFFPLLLCIILIVALLPDVTYSMRFNDVIGRFLQAFGH